MHNGELIWIIGASEGIGAALAREWAARGATLILSARSETKLTALAASLGPQHIPVPIDVSSRENIEVAAETVSKIGKLDRVIHLAALYDPGEVCDIEHTSAAKIVTVNLMGSFHIAQVVPELLRKNGQLALCGSVAGYIGLPEGQIYSATKAAVISLAESLRNELVGEVDVRLISPGFVDTRLTQKNDFTMPAIVSAKQAADQIIKGLNQRRFEVHFPRRFTLGLKLLSYLPYWISLPLIGRFT
jgi:short-subunit dehydrogenase